MGDGASGSVAHFSSRGRESTRSGTRTKGAMRPSSAPVARRCRLSRADPGQLRAAPPCSLQGQPWKEEGCSRARRWRSAERPLPFLRRSELRGPLCRERRARSNAPRRDLPPAMHICRAKRGGRQAPPGRVSSPALPDPQVVLCLSFLAQPLLLRCDGLPAISILAEVATNVQEA